MSSLPSRQGYSNGLLVIDGPTAESLVSIEEAIALADIALRRTSDETAQQDIRRTLPFPGMAGTCLSVMYGSASEAEPFGAKVQSVYPHNFEHGLPSHQGGVLLFDRQTGRPVALINASAITGMRTPAASAVATRALSRPDACELALIGYGEQAERHIATISAVRAISRVRVWGRNPEKAKAFADHQTSKGIPAIPYGTARAAVDGADIVCTVTSAKSPVLMGEWLAPGTHINAVGASVAALQEVDLECVQRSRIWVDYMPMAMAAASDIFEPLAKGIIGPANLIGEIGAVLNGTISGRNAPSEITLYRSLGVPAQDIVFANFIFQKARDLGLGVEVSL
ncbi:ornithine cyclodeaminase family protein [Rhizobium lusitanum]|uniref:Ornithine cyclodeaminase n=1 Tax=Rhizobium lusitanum TaxID=293958 RepID=A0A1C3WDU5_9HYPH|nr:ornithine cyclodeaminase [Rhizobium lusitanum]SCB38036.1 ornithine cyclodeaminase [Rhizobium lusitanum]